MQTTRTTERSIETDDGVSDAEELRRLKQATNPDGTIDAPVLDWQRDGDTVEVTVLHPTQGEFTEAMDWPEIADGSHKFEQVLAAAGYDLDEVERLRSEQATVPIEKDSGNWTISPDGETTEGTEPPGLTDWIIALLLTPIIIPMIVEIGYGSPDPDIYGTEFSTGYKQMAADVLPVIVGMLAWGTGIGLLVTQLLL